ncbi:RNA polymerase sigma factor [Lysobacter humi (ex Lee et al. 2017)]
MTAIPDLLAALSRSESPRLIARTARVTGDIAVAEELVQDVLLQALQHWPRRVPDNPAAWLMTAVRRRAIDHLRQRALHADRTQDYGVELEAQGRHATADEAAMLADDDIGDDLLRLVFVACHPVLPIAAQVALTLRLLGGLRTDEIARAFLVPEPTIAQRIVRAKRMLGAARVPFEVPRREELGERLAAVLHVLYLIFNEGHSATSGDAWTRPPLCDEAIRLGGVLADLLPHEPEVHGLLALMDLQASRLEARQDADGTPVPLAEQDRSRWDAARIERGLQSLARAERLGGRDGPYALQAAIAACHARAGTADATDWPRIAALYARLAALTRSPVVELNRAVADAMAFGPEAGLARIEPLRDDPALAQYHLLPGVRGDLLERVGRLSEAAAEFGRAAALTRNERERRVLLDRAARCAPAD